MIPSDDHINISNVMLISIAVNTRETYIYSLLFVPFNHKK